MEGEEEEEEEEGLDRVGMLWSYSFSTNFPVLYRTLISYEDMNEIN